MDVTISIVATNERNILRDCLLSLRAGLSSSITSEIYVVDNFSDDGTLEMLKDEFGYVKVIRNDRKKSFCENHNMVIEKSYSAYVFIMNSDVFILPGHIEKLVEVLNNNGDAGAVMGKLISGSATSHNGIIDSTGLIIHKSRRTFDRGQGEKDTGKYEEPGEIFSPSGAAMLCRKEMLDEVLYEKEYFDPAFYAYKEELDLCWRARLLGWSMLYEPKAVAYHLRGWGTGTKRSKLPRWIRRHSYKNRYLMMIKNDFASNIIKDLPYILLHELKALIFVVFREPHLLLAWIDLIRLMPITFKKRRHIMEGAQEAGVSAADMRKWFK
jgi:GT2 family glycosyltransferase